MCGEKGEIRKEKSERRNQKRRNQKGEIRKKKSERRNQKGEIRKGWLFSEQKYIIRKANSEAKKL